MTDLLLPFTHPNAIDTIMYSLERDDGFVCSLACNISSFWDRCDNAVIGRKTWSWNNYLVNGLQQSTVASSVRFFMYNQLYRRSTRSNEAPLSPLHSPITCSYNIPILFESSVYTLSSLRFWLARNARAYTSARSIGFCVIWVCISSSSSSGTN